MNSMSDYPYVAAISERWVSTRRGTRQRNSYYLDPGDRARYHEIRNRLIVIGENIAGRIASRAGVPDEANWILMEASHRAAVRCVRLSVRDSAGLEGVLVATIRYVTSEANRDAERGVAIVGMAEEYLESLRLGSAMSHEVLLRRQLVECVLVAAAGNGNREQVLRVLLDTAGRPKARDWRAVGITASSGSSATHRFRRRAARTVRARLGEDISRFP
jgi:hypothetical protein